MISEILKPFDATSAKALVTALDGLRTFAEVAKWDALAHKEIEKIRAYLPVLQAAEAQAAAAESQAREAHASKSLFRRALSAPNGQKAAETLRAEVIKLRGVLSTLADQLEAAIDKTPNSPDEQKEMLQDLKLAKKELTLQKRQAAEAMRQIRVDARQRTAKVGIGMNAFFSNPTTRRWSKIGIRLEKEAAVAPHESERTRIEKRLLVIERAIQWVERFKGDSPRTE